ncbi:alpha/beta hydrolase [Risungbinella massiliensis]|uniref:alpha/beta hydrolase n=1 Tax=Risungbinella massiliensis TaxID=1329796 RepID=UPI0005CC27D8|nr:alpha/beta hydrolase [Risungbinella massiliensis]
MKPSFFTFQTTDHAKIYVHKWKSDSSPIGIVQIAHGMAEHSKRYHEFATKLVEAGYVVYANDHRGHGQTAGKEEELGYFAEENGWELVVDDLYQLTNIIKKEYPQIPFFLFGHSMGSFLSRRYIQKYGMELDGVILSGTGADQGILSWLGIQFANVERKIKGKRTKSNLLNRLVFGNFNRAFQPIRTEFDYLSRDEREVDKYIADPFCGYVPTTSFFYDLFSGVNQSDKPENLNQVPKNLPIFLFSGDQDPVGDNGRGVLKTYHHFQKAGIVDVSYKLYPGGRHEMLNESNREEVYQDVIAWLNKHLPMSKR